MARQRREFSEAAPGVVRVRLAGDASTAGVLVTILRDHPSVEVLTGPDRYDGGRHYLLVRVASPEEIPARLDRTDTEGGEKP